MTMEYCPPNSSVTVFWTNHGISECLMDTLSSAVIAGFLMIFGLIQLFVYRKYATSIDDQIRRTKLYILQIFLTLFLPMLSFIRFLLQATYYEGGKIYGYMVLAMVLIVAAYLFSLLLITKERYYLLPSVPTRGHGLVLLLFWTLLFVSENLDFVNLRHQEWWFNMKTTKDKIEMTLFIVRYISTLFLFMLGLKAPGIMSTQENLIYDPLNDENQSTFRNAWRKLATLFPYIWPKKSFLLQLRVLACIACLIGGRVVNVFVPLYNKKIVDSLVESDLQFRWDWILYYVLFKFLQGGGAGSMGFLNNLRSYLWIQIQQFTTREIEIELFRHLHSLSLRWHLGRKTGEVLRVMDRGTDSINSLLNYIIFSITPTIVDIIIAIIFFVSFFNGWFGLIVFTTMSLYIASTIMVTEWRTKYQRRMNLADNAQKARSVDSLLNYETVKYYGAEKYEVEAYRQAILKYQTEEWRSIFTLNILNSVQNVIVCAGLLAGSLLCAYMVVEGKGLTSGDYVLFASYIIQLYVPLNWFGTYYRAIQKNFVDMENMFDLMKEEEEVIDAPGASSLQISDGDVRFNNVNFGYTPDRTVLRNVSFYVPAGKTLAIVGPSGAGKSTIMRLLFRFYDVEDGAILIDGQNVKTVTQESLRRAIGVVPQDTVLFNNSIKYNIEYGKIGAPEADVITAAKSADIHQRILTFPDKYDTQVGERGLRLSGGEKQRVAIARTILKSPFVVLLDEATSALDTQTERNIQTALMRVCSNRTTIIIAHRLSTIIHADEILVLKDGEIQEKGRHEDLLQRNGTYASMWNQQLQNLEVENLKNQERAQELLVNNIS